MHTAATRRAYLSSRASSRAKRGSGPRGAGRAWRGGGRQDFLEILGGGHVPGGASRADASSYLSAQNALPQTLNALPQTAPINPTRRKGCVKLLASPKGTIRRTSHVGAAKCGRGMLPTHRFSPTTALELEITPRSRPFPGTTGLPGVTDWKCLSPIAASSARRVTSGALRAPG